MIAVLLEPSELRRGRGTGFISTAGVPQSIPHIHFLHFEALWAHPLCTMTTVSQHRMVHLTYSFSAVSWDASRVNLVETMQHILNIFYQASRIGHNPLWRCWAVGGVAVPCQPCSHAVTRANNGSRVLCRQEVCLHFVSHVSNKLHAMSSSLLDNRLCVRQFLIQMQAVLMCLEPV